MNENGEPSAMPDKVLSFREALAAIYKASPLAQTTAAETQTPEPPPPQADPPEPSCPAEPDLVTDATGLALNLIQPGNFRMGENGAACSPANRPSHEVTITRPFHLSVHLVTQAQYEQVMGVNPALFKGPERPVERVSWDDALAFCHKLSEIEGAACRLPTEAEWEYACRAGSEAAYCFGDSEILLQKFAWFLGNSECATHDVGKKSPNAWGLYDMHGGVREWCQDWYGAYPAGSQTDPRGPEQGHTRILRGGSWANFAPYCNAAHRARHTPDTALSTLGFRVARAIA